MVIDEGDIFRRADGQLLAVTEVFGDGWLGCDLVDWPYGPAMGFIEISPNDLINHAAESNPSAQI